MVISILKAEYKGNFRISFQFSDQTEKTVDFKPFLDSSKNGMTRKYLDEQKFKDFKIEFGDIQWNDFELCFPIWDLHKGKI